jgi:uncharacterized repeat protein (TIGR03803 family)
MAMKYRLRPLFHQLSGGLSVLRRWREQRPSKRIRLHVEVLESRWLPSLVSLASFNYTYGSNPNGSLVEDGNGNLFGTTASGGAANDGVVFEVKAGSGTITTLASFNGANGANPSGGLFEDSSGNLFGTTESGGAANDGVVFEVQVGSGTITTLASFNGANGAGANGSLIEDNSGNLFGTTASGGAANDGTVFEVQAGSGTITTLASFNGTNGSNAHCGLVEDSNGNLFGTTASGGADKSATQMGYGTVFEVQAGSGTIATLVSFDFTNGAYPAGSLVEDSNGNLFGTTQQGGASFDGTVFEVQASSGTLTTLASLNDTNGRGLISGLVEDRGGNLFATAFSGGPSGYGTVFEMKAGSDSITTLVAFNSTNGSGPNGSLVVDGSGNLFGTTTSSSSNDGMVFEVQAGSGTLTTLASFIAPNGYSPSGSLVEDRSGNLFGTAAAFGPGGYGTVFEEQAGSNALTTLASFNGANGATPNGDLIEDSGGDLFGTTSAGGASGDGTVFEVQAGSDSITTLASFNRTNGSTPASGLFEDSSGDLFGTTSAGGAFNEGTVFEVQAGSDSITALASFNGTNGADPHGGVVEDSNGNFFGATQYGGASNDGTVFEVKAGSDSITALTSFNGTNGSEPLGGVIEDSNGNLFGTTYNGGASDDGTVFEVKAGSGTITTLASFNSTNGAFPEAGLIEDSNGNLFGTAELGGAPDKGTVFEVQAGSGTITTLASFTDTNGAFPTGALIEDSRGDLFGTTTSGGVSGYGTLFKLAVASSSVAVFDPTTATWYLNESNNAGYPTAGQFVYGAPGWIALTGDFTGDGQNTVVVVDPSTETWYIRNSIGAGGPSYTPFQYGAPGWIPVVGDWNGSGVDGIGVYDPTTATWYLRNEVGPGGADAGQFVYGAPGWIPVVGNWAGNTDGQDGIGVVDPTTETWYLRDTPTVGGVSVTPFVYGAAGWTPLSGDWMGSGASGIGVYDPNGNFYLRNEATSGLSDAGQFAYGAGGWTPLAGNWVPPHNPPQHLFAAGVGPGAPALSNAALQNTVQEALGLLSSAGVNPALVEALASATYTVADLPPGVLGETFVQSNTVEISADASGYGWYVDASPVDSVFGPGGTAQAGSAAAGEEDLLTAVLHEMGHLAGQPDVANATTGSDLMDSVLPLGVRRIDALDSIFASANFS